MRRVKAIRGLRIAWSVSWGILCVLLIVLWVRSYKVGGYLRAPIRARTFYAVAEEGELELVLFQFPIEGGWEMGLRAPKDSNSISIAEALGFRVTFVTGFYCGLTLPYWAGLLACISIANAPWICRLRRFSLRTLLIATTLIAVVMGLVVWGFAK
jgi:hypothetical protein